MAKVELEVGEDTYLWPGGVAGYAEVVERRKTGWVAGGGWNHLLLCRSPEEEDWEGMDPEREAEDGDVRREVVGADEDRRLGVADRDPAGDSIQERGEVVRRMGGTRQEEEEEEGNVGVLRPDTMHAAEVLRRLDMGLAVAEADAGGDQRAGTGDKEKDEDRMDEVDGLKVVGGPRKGREDGQTGWAAAGIGVGAGTGSAAMVAAAAAAGRVGRVEVVGVSSPRREVWRRSWGAPSDVANVTDGDGGDGKDVDDCDDEA